MKGARYVTHFRRLDGDVRPLANFFASGVLALREKLGPFLWQLPPFLRFEPARVERFLAALPRDTAEALALARRRDRRMHGRSRLAIDATRPLRHAVEIRHESFLCEAFIEALRRHNVALVVADAAGRWPLRCDLTADFVYVRLHGATELYASGYGAAALDRWAGRIRAWACGTQVADARCISRHEPPRRATRDVYCYFDNDVKVRAPFDARRLMLRLGLPPPAEAVPFPPASALRRVRPAVLAPDRRWPVARSRRPRSVRPRASRCAS